MYSLQFRIAPVSYYGRMHFFATHAQDESRIQSGDINSLQLNKYNSRKISLEKQQPPCKYFSLTLSHSLPQM
jgi:hypothetical protein